MLKTNNIKNLVNNLDRFYQVDLGIHYGVDIDANAIGRDSNPEEIMKLVNLILGVLVECEHKEEYIGNIMCLDEQTQHELMVILEGVGISI